MTVSYHKRFDKQYKKLKLSVQNKFKERRNIFLSDPFHPLLDNHPLNPPFAGSRSINITGDYRAISNMSVST